jgi:signal transduction histidine kinase
VIEHILSLMRFEAEERKIILEQSVERDLPPLMGDETQIGQVLVNVLVNAFHAMPQGGRCRVIACDRRQGEARSIEVSVQDTGIGITRDELPRLFEPFYTTKSGGTGLGLSIAYRIMQDHGGTIHVSSQPGSGTTVVMQFPVAVRQPQHMEIG